MALTPTSSCIVDKYSPTVIAHIKTLGLTKELIDNPEIVIKTVDFINKFYSSLAFPRIHPTIKQAPEPTTLQTKGFNKSNLLHTEHVTSHYYYALDVVSNVAVTIKEFKPCESKQIFHQTVEFLKNLDKKHFIEYKGYFLSNDNVSIVFEDTKDYGDLVDFTDVQFNESEIACIIRQVLQSLVYLESIGCVHGHIAEESVHIGINGEVKLWLLPFTDIPTRRCVVGSPYWVAPEIILNDDKTPSSDVWSLGSLVYCLANEPWLIDYPPEQVVYMIATNQTPQLDSRKVHPDCIDFINSCVCDKTKRLSAKSLLEHDFIKAACTKKHLESVVKKAVDEIDHDFFDNSIMHG